MTTFDQELISRYVAAGADIDLDMRRVARATFVRDTIRTFYAADKQYGADPAETGSLAELVDAAEEHLEHITKDASRSVTTPRNTHTGGDPA